MDYVLVLVGACMVVAGVCSMFGIGVLFVRGCNKLGDVLLKVVGRG